MNVNRIEEFVARNLYLSFFYSFSQDDQVLIQTVEIVLIVKNMKWIVLAMKNVNWIVVVEININEMKEFKTQNLGL